MITYECRCSNPTCGIWFEIERSIKDDNPILCPVCGAKADIILAQDKTIIFRGDGWADKDYGERE